jgi:hypothetical protein
MTRVRRRVDDRGNDVDVAFAIYLDQNRQTLTRHMFEITLAQAVCGKQRRLETKQSSLFPTFHFISFYSLAVDSSEEALER